MMDLSPPPADLLDGAALFLDFDGTLVELAETPDTIEVPPRLGPLLQRLCRRLGGRVAIVSGRSLADLRRHVPAGDIGFSGSHGLELQLADGTQVPLHQPRGLRQVRDEVHLFAGKRDGLLVEEKPAGVALHYRRAPDEEPAVTRFMEELGGRHALLVQRGRMVVELRPPGADKGDAVRALMAQEGFAGAKPIFAGDDLTDEHAFEAVAAMGGAGVLVGPERQTAALHRLPTVGAFAAWLEASA